MGKTLVLDRVSADLSRGRTHPAIQRLSSLVAAYPTDLDLRRRLAAVYRRVGNRIQAGRWDYLTIGADAADTSAFERAFPSAMARLRAVRWPHRASAAATSYARNRLAKLIAAAEAEARTGRTAQTEPGPQAAPGPQVAHAAPSRQAAPRRRRRDPLAAAAAQLETWFRGPQAILASAALLVATALAVVGGVTVLEWIVQ